MVKKVESAEEAIGPHTIRKIPATARVIDEFTSISKQRNLIWTFSDFDVTVVREHLKAHKEKTGEGISFTGFLLTCFARVVEQHKYPMNTMRKRKRDYYTFDDVDVMTNIERTLPSGLKKPTNYTVRKANEKTLRQIHDEIRKAQAVRDVKISRGNKKSRRLANVIAKIPSFLRKPLLRYIMNDPIQKKKMMGTVGVSAVGMQVGNAKGKGHMIHITPHNISMGVGSIGIYPMTVDGKIISREVLGITLAMDHATIDGGPATRFFYDLREMITKDCIEADWCFKSL